MVGEREQSARLVLSLRSYGTEKHLNDTINRLQRLLHEFGFNVDLEETTMNVDG